MKQQVKVSAVILAAGSSQRMGFNKMAYEWQGESVLLRSLRAFAYHPDIYEVILVADERQAYVQQAVGALKKPVRVVPGGRVRAESAANGVRSASGEYVAIHDAARPFVDAQLIRNVVQAAMQCGAAAPAVPVKDTIKQAEGGRVMQTPARSTLFAIQTPQCFCRQEYLTLLEHIDIGEDMTDDCMLFERAAKTVQLTRGSYENRKITTPDDLPMGRGGVMMDMRIGHGYDVHRFAPQRRLVLGGVDIPHELGLLGHSDADVLTHAVMDALLGAAAKGDIGKLFPDTDNAYEGADSMVLLRRVAQLLADDGWKIENIDATVVCQRPRLALYIECMREKIAQASGAALEAVSVKATTEEGLGFTGQGQGVAAHAVCLLQRTKAS